jgi:hypothetical protein
MTLARLALRITAAAAVSVAVAVAVTQVISNGRWHWPWLAAALALAILAEILNQWLGHRDPSSQPRPVLWPSERGSDGAPKRFCELAPLDLGAHPSRFGATADGPYIPRISTDGLLATALSDEGSQDVIVPGGHGWPEPPALWPTPLATLAPAMVDTPASPAPHPHRAARQAALPCGIHTSHSSVDAATTTT